MFSPFWPDIIGLLQSLYQITFGSGNVPLAPTATLGTNTTQIATTAFVIANAGSTTFGNPTASVGLTAVNGVATSAMRSDGAPALDQTISPTWTGVHTFTPTARSSGSSAYMTVNAPADTALTASTEAIGVNFVGATRQHATGTLTTQRAFVVGGDTLSFVAASTVTNPITADFNPPVLGTNATFTSPVTARFNAPVSGVAIVAKASGTTPGDILQGQSSAGTTLSSMSSTGTLRVAAGSTSDLAISNTSQTTTGFFFVSARNAIDVQYGATPFAEFGSSANGIAFSTGFSIGWFSGALGTTLDLYITRSAAGVAQINMSGGSPGSLIIGQATTGTNALLAKAIASRTAAIINLQTSAGGSLGNMSGGCIGDVIANVSTTSTDGTFNTLRTDTLVANALIANGDKVYFDYTCTVATHTTNTADFKLAFAGITIWDSGALTFAAAGRVRIFGYITRVTSTTALATITFDAAGSTTIVGYSDVVTVPPATLTGLTLTGTNNLVLSAAAAGTGAASGDITMVHATFHIDGFGS